MTDKSIDSEFREENNHLSTMALQVLNDKET